MKRRQILAGAGTGAAVAATTTLSAPAFAQNRRFRIEMVTSWPEALTTLYGTPQYFARRIGEMTDGAVQVRTYPGGAQVGPLEVYDAVSTGAFEACHTAPYYFIGKSPAHGFYTALPFGLTLAEQDSWLLAGNGQALWDELNEPDNLVAFPGGNTGAQTGGWFNKEINSPDDLVGLRMRFPGHGGRTMAKAGVNVQQLPGGEVFTAMERGVLDAAEWVGPFDDQILGMHRVARYYYMPSWAEASAMLGFYFNKDFWNDLPADIRAQIKACCYECNAWMAAQYQARNPVALRELEDYGVEVRNFPESVLAAFERGAEQVHEEDMQASSIYRKIYADWSEFRDTVRSWNQRTTHQYERFIYRS